MKKTVLALAFILTLFTVQGQERTFRAFKLDFAYGRAFPFGSNRHNGGIFAIEPKHAFTDNLTAGLRLELANIGPKTVTVGYIPDFNLTTSMALTADYYFNTNKVRPFAGLGLGMYSTPALDNPDTEEEETQDDFGFFPRAGVETGRFRAALEINSIKKTPMGNFSYLALKVGVFLGGGRISEQR